MRVAFSLTLKSGRQRGEPVECGEQVWGPRPGPLVVHDGAAGVAGDARGGVPQPLAQGLGRGAGQVAFQQQPLLQAGSALGAQHQLDTERGRPDDT